MRLEFAPPPEADDEPADPCRAERALLAAVLARACQDYLFPGWDDRDGRARLSSSARAWIFGPPPPRRPGGGPPADHVPFRDACEAVGVDPGRLRRALRGLKESGTGRSLRRGLAFLTSERGPSPRRPPKKNAPR